MNDTPKPRQIGRPARPQPEHMYKVSIKKVTNGFVVEVGCRTFIATTLAEIFDGIELYFKDPDAAEKIYCTDLNL